MIDRLPAGCADQRGAAIAAIAGAAAVYRPYAEPPPAAAAGPSLHRFFTWRRYFHARSSGFDRMSWESYDQDDQANRRDSSKSMRRIVADRRARPGLMLSSEARSLLVKRVGLGLIGALIAGLLVGVPTDIIDTPFFTRMTPVRWWDYPFWVFSSLLTGAVLASYVSPRRTNQSSCTLRTVGGGALAALAVGCPLCNKIVVALIGASGALSYFAPIQPLLGGLSLALLALTLGLRVRQGGFATA
jgi:hypothetical protein